MSEMVEKVRDALATPQMRATLAAAGLEYEPGQDAFLERYARAAIEAMRDPTEEMKEAAMDILLYSGDIREDADGRILIETITPRMLLNAMIDAALSEEAR